MLGISSEVFHCFRIDNYQIYRDHNINVVLRKTQLGYIFVHTCV